MRLTFGMLQSDSSGIAAAIGIASTDPRFTSIVNEAQQSLVERPEKWWGTTQVYQVCATDDCFTWPRQFAAIEAVDICNRPTPIRNQWYEFQTNGTGYQSGATNGTSPSPTCSWRFGYGSNLIDRGVACCFQDILGQGQIKVYCDVAETAGAQILLQGYDNNGNWIRTLGNGGVWVDGEYVTLTNSTPQTTVNTFSVLTGVQKPVTNGNVRLYQITSATTQMALAVYDPDETLPTYRRSSVPGLSQVPSCGTSSCGSNTNANLCVTRAKSVIVVAKMMHIAVSKATDYMVLTSVPAFLDMCQAVKMRRSKLFDDAAKYEATAVERLKAQMKHYMGDGVKATVSVNSQDYNSGAVYNMI
jgi:hypothetical protein